MSTKKYEWIGNHCFIPGIGEPKTGDIIYLTKKQAEQYKNSVREVKTNTSFKTQEDN